MAKRLRIESTGNPHDARVLIDGELVENVVSARVDFRPGEITATIVVANPSVVVEVDSELTVPLESFEFKKTQPKR